MTLDYTTPRLYDKFLLIKLSSVDLSQCCDYSAFNNMTFLDPIRYIIEVTNMHETHTRNLPWDRGVVPSTESIGRRT